jgi:hypothetical protein
MPLSVVDLYRDILPKTNCKECGYATCMAFASMVVSEKLPLKNCPYLKTEVIEKCQKELDAQYAADKWLKRDMAQDALQWAKKKSASMDIKGLPERIGGKLVEREGAPALELPYFNDVIYISKDRITKCDGTDLTRWEQVFIYNHLAQGGASDPKGKWKAFAEFPNTVSKVKSMISHVEIPLIERFKGKTGELVEAAERIGGVNKTQDLDKSNLAMLFVPLPKVPVMLMFWDEVASDGFEAQVKLLFDDTVTEHLDIESIMFLSERLKDLLFNYVENDTDHSQYN